MKILYHFRTQGTGAEGVHIAGVAQAFEALGHEVVFSSPTGVDPRQTAGANPFGKKERRSLLGRFAAHAPRVVFELMEIAYNLVARRRHEAMVRHERFDFIYERHAFYLWSTAMLAQRRGIPLVVEVNELAGDERIRATPVLLPLAEWADRQVFRRARTIVTVSPHLKRRIAAMGVEEGRILVLPNAVDESMLAAPDRRAEVRGRLGLNDEIVFGFVGWFVPWHRLDRLLTEFATVAAKDDRVRLMLVGDGPLKEPLVEQATALGIRERLLLPGPVPHAEVPAMLDAMDVALVPHSNEYRSPIKLFEAMARARLVVAPATEPINSVVLEDETALLFAPEDPAALRRQLERAAGDASLRSQIGAAARKRIEQQHTWQENARAVLESVAQ